MCQTEIVMERQTFLFLALAIFKVKVNIQKVQNLYCVRCVDHAVVSCGVSCVWCERIACSAAEVWVWKRWRISCVIVG